VQQEEVFTFQPGQFITMDLPIHEKRNKRLRSYSIASAPNLTSEIELVIVLLPGGLGTEYLFNEVREGSTIVFKGALGHFTLPAVLPNDLFLICTGTGIAPFRSMASFLAQSEVKQCNIYLIFGTRTYSDILYAAEMRALQDTMPHFKFIPVLSREAWQGEQGYVHAVYQKLAAGKPQAEFMLCGWRAMIDEARSNLAAMGYNKTQVHFELYG
jgi:ferredoxin-NADP reductase